MGTLVAAMNRWPLRRLIAVPVLVAVIGIGVVGADMVAAEPSAAPAPIAIATTSAAASSTSTTSPTTTTILITTTTVRRPTAVAAMPRPVTTAVPTTITPFTIRSNPAPAGTGQIVVVASPRAASASGTMTAYQLVDGAWRVVFGPVRAQLGRNGISSSRQEGDGTTPAGTFGFGSTMYGLGDPVSGRYSYHSLVCGDWWSGEDDVTYNTFRQEACGAALSNSEALWMQTTAYQHFAVIDFNSEPAVPGRGSGIFLHDYTTSGVTAGCVALPPSTLDGVLGWLDPAQHPIIQIGTVNDVSAPTA